MLPVLEIQKLRTLRSNLASRPLWTALSLPDRWSSDFYSNDSTEGVPQRLTKQSFQFGRAFGFFFFNKIKLKYTILGLPDGPVAKTPHSLMQGARVPSLVRELDLRSCSQISCIAAKEIEGLVFCS